MAKTPKANDPLLAKDLDRAIGMRIRERRRELRMSQQLLAERIDVTFQQVQKYERGANRVSFSRLVAVADALQCQVADLSAGLEEQEHRTEIRHLNRLMARDGAFELLEAFDRIDSADLRRALLAHARVLSEIGAADS